MSLILIVNVVLEGSFGDAVGTKPEKKPSSRGWQGLSKLDCTTEWFYGVVSSLPFLFVSFFLCLLLRRTDTPPYRPQQP